MLGEWKQGSQTLNLPLQVTQANVRLKPQSFSFSPPRPSLTSADGRMRITLTVSSTEGPVSGSARVRLYLAPAGSDPYQEAYWLAENTVTLPGPSDIQIVGHLNAAQLSAVNAGRLTAGVEVIGNLDQYRSNLTVSWRITELYLGVGVL